MSFEMLLCTWNRTRSDLFSQGTRTFPSTHTDGTLTTAETSLTAMYQDRLHSRSVATQDVSSISDSCPVLTNALACTVCACSSATAIQRSRSETAGLKRKGGLEFRWILPKGAAKEGAIHCKRGAFTPRSKPHCPFDPTQTDTLCLFPSACHSPCPVTCFLLKSFALSSSHFLVTAAGTGLGSPRLVQGQRLYPHLPTQATTPGVHRQGRGSHGSPSAQGTWGPGVGRQEGAAVPGGLNFPPSPPSSHPSPNLLSQQPPNSSPAASMGAHPLTIVHTVAVSL